jgi:hypothetical protein
MAGEMRGALPSSSPPRLRIWIGSVNVISMFVSGSTSVSLRGGTMAGVEGEPDTTTSGASVSPPTVEAASPTSWIVRPLTERTAGLMRIWICVPTGEGLVVEQVDVLVDHEHERRRVDQDVVTGEAAARAGEAVPRERAADVGRDQVAFSALTHVSSWKLPGFCASSVGPYVLPPTNARPRMLRSPFASTATMLIAPVSWLSFAADVAGDSTELMSIGCEKRT